MRPYLTLHDPGVSAGYYEQGLWTQDTFYTLLAQQAKRFPSGIALRDDAHLLDWLTLKNRVDALADVIASNNIHAGERVSIWMSNRIETIIAFLACSRLGVACNPSLHRTYTCGEIIDLLTELQASALITEPGWGSDRDRQDFEAMLAPLPFLKAVLGPDDFPEVPGTEPGTIHDNSDSVAYLAFTSGTTGKPKCVMHSANTLLANARDLVRDWNVSNNDVILTLSPLSHHIAWVAVGQWLVSGATLVIDRPAKGASRLDWIVQTGATYVMGVPTHAMDILQEQKQRGLKRLGSVRVFYMAGAPIPEVLAQSLLNLNITPQNIYGMTENSSHQYTYPDDPPEIWTRTCGRGGPAYTVKVWDPDHPDTELAPGQVGEIGGRGAALMLGYYGNQTATEASFNRHGYMMSGDLGSLDEKGNLRIEGRSKDLIIRGGHNIYPSHIESAALTHENVVKAAAFPVADDRLGEKVCLAIIGTATGAELLAHLAAEGLSRYDMPEWFISMDQFPLTPSGKILKRELVEYVRNGTISPEPIRYQTEGV